MPKSEIELVLDAEKYKHFKHWLIQHANKHLHLWIYSATWIHTVHINGSTNKPCHRNIAVAWIPTLLYVSLRHGPVFICALSNGSCATRAFSLCLSGFKSFKRMISSILVGPSLPSLKYRNEKISPRESDESLKETAPWTMSCRSRIVLFNSSRSK